MTVVPKVERAVWAHGEPTTTITTPDGWQVVVCLHCGDELRTRFPQLACHFRDWHLTTHVHKERERKEVM
jgi:hypothetical protein